ncbi:potassium channel family protein [Paraburkholderia sediminicola]|uniref:potassium channel family protein n=1 Tax=Paraburkholderia sediminicola TaxID=458836 RepID=UPI0038BC77BD
MTFGRRRDRTGRLRVGSMALLLCLLILDVFVVPFALAPNSFLVRIARDVLLSLILLSGIAAVSDNRRQCVTVSAAAGVAIMIRGTAWLFPLDRISGLLDVTALLSLAILGAVVGIKVFGTGRATFDRILGAVALYILIGVVWAEAYQLVNSHIPAAYAGMTHESAPHNRATWLYFSFVTLTTVGYGDITPVTHIARSLAILEALIGQLYPAIVLARLVSLHVAADDRGRDAS